MENQPTQPQASRWPADVDPGKGRSGNSAPPVLWLVIIGLLALIFWHFVPKSEVEVPYAPWFLQQVDDDNIQSLAIQGTEARGVLRQLQPYQRSTSQTAVQVRRFYTYFPSDASIEPVVQKLIRPRPQGALPPVVIEGQPSNQSAGLAWLLLLLPTFVVLGLIYVMLRRARDRFDQPPRGQSP